ncbi:ribonuclease P/MRP protein subunit POP5-like protein [Leptotrombidium deliense]|uniref:Ribonuclease P/MRP protein subunit POP5 n=1 Tax=Leptotrombidium deliense TaxID=299467 RepID=A0A443S7H3_9ACAR|nr:ribonuclease P/MRP protein subunit POP5-like protein [Leptotrombidium deliense]
MVRVKRRHVLFKFVTSDPFSELPFDEKQVLAAIRSRVHELHGDFGLGSLLMSLHIKKFDKRTHIALISCRREPARILMTSLPLVNKIGPHICTIQMLKFSGTIRSCLKFLTSYYEHENKSIKVI